MPDESRDDAASGTQSNGCKAIVGAVILVLIVVVVLLRVLFGPKGVVLAYEEGAIVNAYGFGECACWACPDRDFAFLPWISTEPSEAANGQITLRIGGVRVAWSPYNVALLVVLREPWDGGKILVGADGRGSQAWLIRQDFLRWPSGAEPELSQETIGQDPSALALLGEILLSVEDGVVSLVSLKLETAGAVERDVSWADHVMRRRDVDQDIRHTEGGLGWRLLEARRGTLAPVKVALEFRLRPTRHLPFH